MANTHSIDLELSSSQYLTAADSASLSVTGNLTMEFWLKLEQLPSTVGTNFFLMGKWDAGENDRSYGIQISTDNKLALLISDDGTVSNWFTYVLDEAFDAGDLGVWIHFAVSVIPSTKTVVFYKNGSPADATASTSAGTVNSIDDNASLFVVGARVSSATPQFFVDGKMDEGRLWNDIRTSSEISDNYDQELVGDEAGLVAYWKLNDSLLDETSNDNDLTNNNSATFSTDVPFSGAVSGNSNFFLVM